MDPIHAFQPSLQTRRLCYSAVPLQGPEAGPRVPLLGRVLHLHNLQAFPHVFIPNTFPWFLSPCWARNLPTVQPAITSALPARTIPLPALSPSTDLSPPKLFCKAGNTFQTNLSSRPFLLIPNSPFIALLPRKLPTQPTMNWHSPSSSPYSPLLLSGKHHCPAGQVGQRNGAKYEHKALTPLLLSVEVSDQQHLQKLWYHSVSRQSETSLLILKANCFQQNPLLSAFASKTNP